MEKAYQPAKYESKVRAIWDRSNAFAPSGDQSKKPFSIIMPPPNANGILHAGHLMYVVEDIATRYHRMQGVPTLWLPGTDHAGIETQYVYERELQKRGLTRFDLGPSKFYDEVMTFTRSHQQGIIDGFQSMGFSADWSKLKFTLDEDIISIVYDTFEQLHRDGHIYRGNRIVNWCPRCQAAFPDIETDHVTREDAMYTLDYGSIQIATTRPETIFADSAIAVNLKDTRYKKLIGKSAKIPLTEREVVIIADDHVDPKAGTGALKVTPAHDFHDYEIGQRHNLAEIIVIDFDGKMINLPEEFAGLSTEQARQKIVDALKKSGQLIKTTPITHAVAVHDRCKTVIEPLISEQWFLRVAKLNKPVIEAIESGKVTIFPARYKRVALNWLAQEHDWCISRPGWWGIRIPIFYKTSNDPTKESYLIARTEDEAIKYYGEGNYRAETDTFDTWFSSSQWPYATLMSSGDFEQFYPTSMMGTAREILHKWVTRMIMFSLYKTGQVPFENVYLWGMVTDDMGQKLSKSKANYEDPMQITAKYGTDALRLALSIGITPGNDGKLHEEKIIGYRNFCNKVWNAARYVTTTLGDDFKATDPTLGSPADHWMANKLNQSISSITKNIDNFRFSDAGSQVYSLLWDQFADQYLEASKLTTNPAMLARSLEIILRLAHPFAPFVTEAIWQELPWQKTNLVTEKWPKKEFKPDAKHGGQFELEVIKILAQKDKAASNKNIAALKRELAAKQNLVKLAEAKLSNQSFVEYAPSAIVAGERARLESALESTKKLEAELENYKEKD